MYTRNETLSRIATRCGVVREADQEQIIDILLGRTTVGENKYETFLKTTEDWTPNEWRSLLREFYASFNGAKLPKLLFYELGMGGDVSTAIQAQREITPIKNAVDAYYNYLLNMDYSQPVPAKCREHENEILLSAFVAVEAGENYGTMSYPPEEFIQKVAGLEISREEYMGAILNLMNTPKSFEARICEIAKYNPSDVARMRSAYQELLGIGVKKTVETVKRKGAVAASIAAVKAEKVARKIKSSTYVDDEPSRKKSKPRSDVKVNLLSMGIVTRIEFLLYSVAVSGARILLLRGQSLSFLLIMEVLLCIVSVGTALCVVFAIPRKSRFVRMLLVCVNVIVNVLLTIHVFKALQALMVSAAKKKVKSFKWFGPKLPKIRWW